jgi:hypothetical protein
MEYFRLRPSDIEPDVVDQAPTNRAGDLVFVLLHDMAMARSLALGELPVRRRMEDLNVRVEDCDTLGGNLAAIAAQGPQTAEDREILCFYFALGLKGRLHAATGPRRQRTLITLRETLDFLSGVFGPRILANVEILARDERQMLWDLMGGTMLALAREQMVPGVDLAGALMRWAGLFALAPRTDRLLVSRSIVAGGATPSGRLTLIGILDPVADADMLARAITPRANTESEFGSNLAELEGPEPEFDASLVDSETADADDLSAAEALLAATLEPDPTPRTDSASDADEAPVAPPAPTFEVSGRAVPMRSPGRRLLARMTGWAVAERLGQAFLAVFLGVHRDGHLRLTRAGLVYDETLWILGRPARERTVAIPMESMAARLDRRHNLGTLLLGLGAAVVGAFLGTLWALDGLRTGYWPLFVLGAAVLTGGLVVDLLVFRLTGRLRGRSQLVLDGGEGTRIRLDGVRRAEAEALLTALAGPSRFQTPATPSPSRP